LLGLIGRLGKSRRTAASAPAKPRVAPPPVPGSADRAPDPAKIKEGES